MMAERKKEWEKNQKKWLLQPQQWKKRKGTNLLQLLLLITGIWFKTILYKDTQKAVCRSSRIFIFLIDACQKSIQVFCIDIVNRPLLIRKAGFNDIEDHPVVVSSRTAAGWIRKTFVLVPALQVINKSNCSRFVPFLFFHCCGCNSHFFVVICFPGKPFLK